MVGMDAEGYGCFKDKVNNHYLRTFGSAVRIALIGRGIDASMPESSTLAIRLFCRRVAKFRGDLRPGRDQTIGRNLKVQPTLAILPGYKFNVLVDQDIVFPGVYRDLVKQEATGPAPSRQHNS
ncbi:hypothetical protein EOA23_19335 [Mesorhizobium sp. M2A.F.Ca.ET.042.01.1.1]|nr:hypothetical protein EOA23_19335 [Mesorhizobium sp. M2A.F.Ca.ET.042.01.1.1]